MTTTAAKPALPPEGRPALPLLRRVRLLTEQERAGANSELLKVVEHRKSGLSLNWIIGCNLDCGYCVRHLFGNFKMKTPRALMSELEAFKLLLAHPHFEPHQTPIQLLNRATDPMLPVVKPHLFQLLRLLDDHGLTNHVLVITRFRVDQRDCEVLNSFRNIKVTLLVTYSGISDERIEPVDSNIAAASLKIAFGNAERYRTVLYWRPIVPGLNDTDEHLDRALALSHYAHSTVFTGLFYKDEIREYYQANDLPEPYEDGARRKILPEQLEERILSAARSRPPGGSPLFRKTSCAVSYAHGLPDYNGHFGIRELCGICPSAQLMLCKKAWARPDTQEASALAVQLGGSLVEVNDRALVVTGLDEQQRYRMQHTFGHQVHDVDKPHHLNRHGRADLGWPMPLKEPTS